MPETTLSRRTLLAGVATGATTVWLGAAFPTGSTAARRADPWRRALRELDEVILRGMAQYDVPGCAVGLVLGDRTYVRGYGVTNVDDPTPVDGDTVFRIGSTTKTFTGTTVMRLVEQGRIDLDATVRTYLPDFTTADPAVGAQVTVRQLLNHSPGWLGDYFEDFGRGDDALARYVAGMARLPQLTPLGSTFAYNNAAVAAAGRIVEVVTGSTYEDAVRRTADFYLEHPLPRGSEEESRIGDPFDYDAEDRYLLAYEAFLAEIDRIGFDWPGFVHQYDHPKAPAGQ